MCVCVLLVLFGYTSSIPSKRCNGNRRPTELHFIYQQQSRDRWIVLREKQLSSQQRPKDEKAALVRGEWIVSQWRLTGAQAVMGSLKDGGGGEKAHSSVPCRAVPKRRKTDRPAVEGRAANAFLPDLMGLCVVGCSVMWYVLCSVVGTCVWGWGETW